MYEEEVRCVDCGKVFTRHHVQQIRCPECQEEHRRNKDRKRKQSKYAENKEKRLNKKQSGIVYINGHPQICQYMDSCFYGTTSGNGCAYALEERKTRIMQGLYIVDGKCAAYEKKGRRRKRSELNLGVL